MLALPVHILKSMLKALKMNSEEARLKFPRLLQIIELYPSETLDLMMKEVSMLRPRMLWKLQTQEYSVTLFSCCDCENDHTDMQNCEQQSPALGVKHIKTLSHHL